MRTMTTKHWAVFTLIEYMNVAKALCSWNTKEKKNVPRISVYFIAAHNVIVDTGIHLLTFGILDFNGQLQERDKDKVLL